MSCSCQKLNKLFASESMTVDMFLCLHKDKILTNQNMMSALFNQYKNYLYKSARKVANRYPSVELDELISEGFEGILRALEKYDCNTSSFLTYAQHWVRMKMFSAARKSIGLMALPGSMYSVISKVKHLLDSNPSLNYIEISRQLGESQERIAIVLDLIKTPKVGGIATLEDYVTYEDTLTKNPSPDDSIDDDLSQKEFEKRLWAVIENAVTPKEAFVLSLLFGRGGEMRRSLEWVAKVLYVSKERIRQIKDTAFDKLRGSEALAELIKKEEALC